ncbi:MAG: AraC family transcriptional regulator [Candidatus Eisenbacteria bacterium]|nr:AraC family transcriptional regulator [Candidatus Eisenbacteria bacterium]
MHYFEYPLPDEARPHGICLWRFAVEAKDPEAFVHVVPPDGTVTLSASLYPGQEPRLTTTGASVRAHLVPVVHGMSAAGIRLRPGVAPDLLSVPAATLVGAMTPWVPEGSQVALAEAMVAMARDEDAWVEAGRVFGAVARELASPDPLVAQLVDRLLAEPDLGGVGVAMEAVPIGVRQLRRRFLAATGLSPKSFAQMQRLRHACILALENPPRNWSQVAAEAGFSDQAHFSRQVARTFGVSPTVLMEYLRTIRHQLVPQVGQDRRQDDRFLQDS